MEARGEGVVALVVLSQQGRRSLVLLLCCTPPFFLLWIAVVATGEGVGSWYEKRGVDGSGIP
jgi:hypothetical protein